MDRPTKMVKFVFLLIFSTFSSFIPLSAESETQIQTLFYGLNSCSIKENLAFYSLFPDHPLGNKALNQALNCINKHRQQPIHAEALKAWPELSFTTIMQTIGKKSQVNLPALSIEEQNLIAFLSSHLAHHRLKGHSITTHSEVLDLEDHEVDLARTIFLYQFDQDLEKVKSFEAALDLMTLEILAKLPQNPSINQILKAMHELIFFDMGFRFPPHSIWAKDVDTFTFLQSVMDDRFGVCLGISVLYYSIGQRLNLPFFIFTPPGHIFLQAQLEDESLINIETTARGIHLPMEEYLGINTLFLEKRSVKETFGMVLMNYAAVFIEKEDYAKALQTYCEAKPFMPNDPLLHYFIGLNALFCKKPKEALDAYTLYKENQPSNEIKHQTLLEDFYSNRVDQEGLKVIFQSVDENRKSILQKQDRLKLVLSRYPNFRDGLFQLGITYLQLADHENGLKAFQAYHQLDPTNPTIEYYLAQLNLIRLNYKEAKKHLLIAEKLMKEHQKSIKILKPIRLTLMKHLCLDSF